MLARAPVLLLGPHMFCREWTLVKQTSTEVEGTPLKCRSWQCEYCNPDRKSQLIAQGISGRPNKFLTLTTNPSQYSCAAERAQMLVRAFRLLRLRIMRKYGWKKLPFLAVIEKTKLGEPHLHVLLRCPYIDQQFISDTMRELMGAPIVDIRAINGEDQVAGYVAKYVGKDPHKFPGTKRYWCSQDYSLDDYNAEDHRDPHAQYLIAQTDIDDWVLRQMELGSRLLFHDDESFRFRRICHWGEAIMWGVDPPNDGRLGRAKI